MGDWSRRFGLWALAWATLTLVAAVAPARGTPSFESSHEALSKGAIDTAIDELESLADRGQLHADLSFNRGVAYARRGTSSGQSAGDLGQAAAAFEEARQLRPGDAEAERGLTRVRELIARGRAKRGKEPISSSPSLTRSVLSLLSEDLWNVLALLGSLALTLGLLLHLLRPVEHRLPGSVTAGVGALVFVLAATASGTSRHLRVSSTPAVVVTTEARLLDELGRPARSGEYDVIPEGETVFVRERSGRRSRVEWGTIDSWVMSNQLRALGRPGPSSQRFEAADPEAAIRE